MRIGTKSLLNRAESGALHYGTYSLDARFCSRQFLFRSPPPISSSTRRAPLLHQPPPFLGGGRYSDRAHRLFHGAVVLWSSPVTLWMKAGLPLTACEKLKPQRGVPRAWRGVIQRRASAVRLLHCRQSVSQSVSHLKANPHISSMWLMWRRWLIRNSTLLLDELIDSYITADTLQCNDSVQQ